MIKRENEINNLTRTQLLVDYLETYISDPMAFNSFVKDVKIIGDEGNKIIFEVQSEAVLNVLSKSYKNKFVHAVKEVLEREVLIEFVLKGKYIPVGPDFVPNGSIFKENIIEKYTFDNYIKGHFNEQVIKGAKIVAGEEGVYLPFFVHSGSGLGKTHLLHAIGNEVKKRGKKALYINPDNFTFKMTDAMKKGQDIVNIAINEITKFDYLLFDDIQNLGDRSRTLQVLFNIINVAFEKNIQVVITSDKTPNELGGFEDRFITRFEKGLTLQIKQPKLEDLILILKFKLEQEKLFDKSWEDDALEFIARNYSSSIRSIEGAVKRIKFFTMDNNSLKYTYSVIAKIFDQLKINKEELTPSRIVSVVANYYKVSTTDIYGKTRKQEVVLARHISMWLVRSINKYSYKQIGRIFGRDHSTTMTAITKVDTSMKINSAVKLAIKQIQSKILVVS